ncbi:MAG: hypothetical protein II488_05375, partial [Firmicutes bacterium]|nr:hypothetical protein [Bacillota bacterium]
MKKGKRLLTVLLALALIIGCVPFAAFAAEDEIEGGAKAVASIKYNSKTWKPDKDFVISVEVAHNVKTI